MILKSGPFDSYLSIKGLSNQIRCLQGSDLYIKLESKRFPTALAEHIAQKVSLVVLYEEVADAKQYFQVIGGIVEELEECHPGFGFPHISTAITSSAISYNPQQVPHILSDEHAL